MPRRREGCIEAKFCSLVSQTFISRETGILKCIFLHLRIANLRIAFTYCKIHTPLLSSLVRTHLSNLSIKCIFLALVSNLHYFHLLHRPPPTPSPFKGPPSMVVSAQHHCCGNGIALGNGAAVTRSLLWCWVTEKDEELYHSVLRWHFLGERRRANDSRKTGRCVKY